MQQYQTSDNVIAETMGFDQHYHPQQQREVNNPSSDDLSFERPILIESDSDEIEEE